MNRASGGNEAAMELNVAGPVAHRIRIARQEWSDHIRKVEAERDAALARAEAAEARLQLVEQYLPACIYDASLPECTNKEHRRVRRKYLDAALAKAAAAPEDARD